MMLLSDLKVGEVAHVKKINLSYNDKERVGALGLIEGVNLIMLRQAPLGDPVMIKINNFSLALRKSSASKIIVEKL
ncbi:MAG: ferrous iron transport protein A [Clostridiales bacterium]|nr:ferrous iron transport protein A [Clostridiales bacterium]